jgi:NAD(P)-dependent dehydrogenase (short-subunit alcohol dehydrogenase family)
LQAGADVAICARNSEGLKAAESELREIANHEQRVFAICADVGNPGAVDEAVRSIRNKLPGLSGLVNAAGILGPKGSLDEIDVNEWISTIQVNLTGTMLVCRAVLPYFRSRGYGKIVNFSGGGATSPRPRFSAYAASKAAIVRFTENVARELEGTGIDVNAIAPGAVNTRMLEEVLAAGPGQVGDAAFADALRQRDSGGAPAERAAMLCVMLLSGESDGLTGRLISAVWDSWETLPMRKGDLAGSDIYTLRRIVPADRGLDWK